METLDLGRQPIIAAGLAAFSGRTELKILSLKAVEWKRARFRWSGTFRSLKSAGSREGRCNTWPNQTSTFLMFRKVIACRCDLTDAGVAFCRNDRDW